MKDTDWEGKRKECIELAITKAALGADQTQDGEDENDCFDQRVGWSASDFSCDWRQGCVKDNLIFVDRLQERYSSLNEGSDHEYYIFSKTCSWLVTSNLIFMWHLSRLTIQEEKDFNNKIYPWSRAHVKDVNGEAETNAQEDNQAVVYGE